MGNSPPHTLLALMLTTSAATFMKSPKLNLHPKGLYLNPWSHLFPIQESLASFILAPSTILQTSTLTSELLHLIKPVITHKGYLIQLIKKKQITNKKSHVRKRLINSSFSLDQCDLELTF